MINTLDMFYELRQTMDPTAAEKIAQFLGRIYEELRNTVTKVEFDDLKGVVKELAEAQKRTDQRMDTLGQRMEELAEAQKRTDQRMEELAVAMRDTRGELGGLSRSVGYALENEAYRMLPGFLKEKHNIHITQRFVRTEIGGQEINLFGHGRRNGHKVLLVGETKLRLDERRKERRGQKDVFTQLAEKMEIVQAAYPKAKIVPLIVTHYARPKILEQAQAKGIIVAQSFEW